jgi:hypothetical protein
VERYRVVVEDDFDETDDMALQELFAEGLNRPTPYETFESDVKGARPRCVLRPRLK